MSALFSEARAFPSLKKLDLSDTKITEDGAEASAIVTLMRGCSVLQQIVR